MIDINLQELVRKYKSESKPVQFDFRSKLIQEISEHYGDGKKQHHYIHTYPGRIAPHIPFVLLSLKEFENLNGKVLDPFAGTGTILLEAIINPYKSRKAMGIEINPLARLISKVKTSYYDLSKLEECFNKIKHSYDELSDNEFRLIDFPNIELWFSKEAIINLSKLRFAINKKRFSSNYKDFFWVCFTKIIRRIAKADPRIPPPVVLKPEKYKNNSSSYEKLSKHLANCENPQVWKYFEHSYIDNCKLARLYENKNLITKKNAAEIIGDEASEIKINSLVGCGRLGRKNAKKLSKESIDLIITSPPYISAQKYIRSTKLELYWLGFTSAELLSFEKATIGTEYVSKSNEIEELGVQSVDKLITWAYEKSKERGVLIYNYFQKMDVVIKELYRVLKPKGYAIFIMGDNKVLKRKVKTFQLISDLAEYNGFKSILTLKDLIRSRSMITKRNGTGGLIKNEYITILKKER